jgi:hypothetical protein
VPLPKGTSTNDISCSADRYGLDELKRLALRKQGLQSNVQVSTLLNSARWAYSHTPDNDSKLRGHYLTLIIRSRNTFKRSGTMAQEMEQGGQLFFDLFVAMCNHMVSADQLLVDLCGLAKPPAGRSTNSSLPILPLDVREKCRQKSWFAAPQIYFLVVIYDSAISLALLAGSLEKDAKL